MNSLLDILTDVDSSGVACAEKDGLTVWVTSAEPLLYTDEALDEDGPGIIRDEDWRFTAILVIGNVVHTILRAEGIAGLRNLFRDRLVFGYQADEFTWKPVDTDEFAARLAGYTPSAPRSPQRQG